MAIPSSAADSDVTSSSRTVFVDTSLDTSLVLDFPGSTTVADVKKEILIEHFNCFPEVGEIEIRALKVKRRGRFYRLPNSLQIKSAFDRVASSWYLYVDASTVSEQSGKLHFDPNSGNQLACFNVANNSLAIVVSDGPSRWLANLNGSTLSEVEHYQCMNQEIPSTERMCPGDSSRESSEVLVTGLKHTSDNHCKTASMDINKDSELPDKQTECVVGITKCNDILLEESTPKKPTEKKSESKKSSKKREDAVDDLVLKENDLLAGRPSKDTLQQEDVVPLSSLGSAEKETANDARMENGSVVQEPYRNSSSDATKQLVSGVHNTNDLSKGTETFAQQAEANDDKSENGVVDVQPSNVLGEISEHMSAVKKKRKRSDSGVQKTNDLIEEVGVAVKHVNSNNDESEKGIVDVHCSNSLGDPAMHSSPAKKKRKVGKNNSNKDATKGMTTPEHSLGEKHESKNAISDGLDAECTEGIHSLRTSSSTGKKKRKLKSTDPHKVVAAVLSPVRELREESSGVVKIDHKDSEEPQATGIGERLLGEAINTTSAFSLGEKHDGPEEVSKRNVFGSLDVDMGDANGCNLRAETDVPEESAKSGVKEMDTSKSGHVDVNDLPLSTVKEQDGLQVTIEPVDDHKRIGANQTVKTIEARDVYETDDPKDKTPEPASSCKKSKKSKRTSGRTRVMSSTKIGEGLVTDNFSTEHTSVKDDNSGVKGMSTPEHSLGEKHKSKDATLDGLEAKCTEDIHSLRTSSSTGKKKRKLKSTDPHKVVAAVLSPVRELREESSGVVKIDHKDSEEPQATGIEERLLGEAIDTTSAASLGEKHDGPVEVSKRTALGLLDVDMADANVCNLRAETDVLEESAKSGVKDMDTSRGSHFDVSDLPLSTVKEQDGLQMTIELVDDHKRIGANQTDKTIEARDVYGTDDPKEETPEPASSCKKTKKSKKTSGRSRVVSSTKIAEGPVTDNFSTEHTSMKDGDSGTKSKPDGIILSPMEGKDASKLQLEDDISPVATDAKTEKRTPEEVTSLQQISKSQAGGEFEGGKKKRKSRKKQTRGSTDLPEVQEKEQNAGFQIPVPSSDAKLVDVSSKKSKKRKSSKAEFLNPNLVSVKDTGVASSPLHTELLSGTVVCSQVSSSMVKGSDERRTPEVVGNVGPLNSGFIEEDNSQKDVSCVSNRIDFKGYFVHREGEAEVKPTGEVVDNKINKEKKSDKELKDQKYKDKLVIHSASASPDPYSLLRVNENGGSKEKTQGGKSSTIELHGSSLKNESSKPLPKSKKKLVKSNLVSEEARKFNVPDTSAYITPTGKNSKAFAKPTSSFESVKVSQRTKKGNEHQSHDEPHPKSIKKASGSHMGEVVNSTKPKKSLLATSNAIFRDDSSMDSHDHQVRVDSDATTRTPSDSLSSSDGEGSYSSKREEDGGKNNRQSLSAVPKNMTLDSILRGSSRYKKAKLTASQSQPDDAVDFVPDSQADA